MKIQYTASKRKFPLDKMQQYITSKFNEYMIQILIQVFDKCCVIIKFPST